MTNNQLTEGFLQDMYAVAVSCETAERNGAYMAAFDLLCKMDEAGGTAHVVRKLIDMLREGRREHRKVKVEPVYQIMYGTEWRDVNRSQYDDHVEHDSPVRILYTSPPALIVPEDIPDSVYEILCQACGGKAWMYEEALWNACRTSMLNAEKLNSGVRKTKTATTAPEQENI
ncbi:hypothetical protein HII27_25610 [Kluyvera sp. SCKS090646]|uniref:DUF551 domain-containing protein n=1 Tax=Kluyvera sichuanensis TaxID=2725494 RepID=A0ABR6S0V8_9ENTR|nr:hypothetical protein [Kluyvera sichuanensis]MBC1189041.1 hypothetical protein [Kluyvera sichuanensis]